MIDRVLVPTDDNPDRMLPIVEHAVEIVDALGASATLFHVYSEDEFERDLDGMDLDGADPADIAKRNKTVREVAGVFHDSDLDVSVEASVGSPGTEIIKYVEDHDIDHVFLGGRRRSPTGKALMGSVSQEVLLGVEVPCTVLMS